MASKKKGKETLDSIKGQKSEPERCGEICSLCQEYRTCGIKNKFKCCKRCRSVKVKVKNIKPIIPEIKNMLNKHKRLKKSDVRYHKEEKVVTDVQIEDAFSMPNADPEDGRKISLSPGCFMRINVPCAYYPHDVHTTTPQVLQKYFNVELSILFKLGHCSNLPDSVMCTACNAMFLTDGQTISQSILENHVSHIHVPNSTARDYRFVCIMCDGAVYDLLSVRKHVSEKHSALVATTEIGQINKYICELCKDLNKTKSRLLVDKAHQFGSKEELQIHINLVHPGNFTCTECNNNLIFTTEQMLAMHMSAYHPGLG